MKKRIPSILAAGFLSFWVHAQSDTQNEIPAQSFNISIEYRPRTELRYGYRSLPTDTSKVAFLTSQRGRINIDFLRNNFLFHTTLQDIRIWGDTDPRSTTGKAMFYEFYVEPALTKKLSVRVGRQRISYDDERLFAQNDWRQSGSAHDAVRLMYRGEKLEADLIGAYNQSEDQLSGTTYEISWDIYRTLLANFLKYHVNESVTLTAINFTDEYTDPDTGYHTGYWKFTDGGRIEYAHNNLYLTFAAYYQWGKIETGKTQNAYYLQPEVKWKGSPVYTARLGAQVFSGDNNKNDRKSTAFLAQYGAFHRFNGRMDYTQSSVRTYENEGLIDPYLIQDYKLNRKITLSWESHILQTEKALSITEDNSKKTLNLFYGWENDFRLRFKANEYTELEVAYMCLKAGKTIQYLSTGEDGDLHKLAQFAYVTVNWTPEIFHWQH